MSGLTGPKSPGNRLATVDWQRGRRWAPLVGYWSLRVFLGVVLVVYVLSFVGPPPVERAELTYGSPAETATDAVHNLQTATYSVTIDADRADETGETGTLGEWQRTVDNRGHRYAATRRPGASLGNESIPPERLYGTYTTGYAHPTGAQAATDDENRTWERTPPARYHPSRNAFGHPEALDGATATVVTDTAATYAVRVEDRRVVADLVDVPGHTQRRDDRWNATLTLRVSRSDDRLTRAEYRYRLPETGEEVRATYRFEYGPAVDVDRPIGTYPPGSEVVTRLDLGVRTIDEYLGGLVS